MALSGMERAEIMNRTRAMSDDELAYTLKFIPTSELLGEVSRREGVIIDRLADVCQLWDDLTLEKDINDMDILEKEELMRRLRRCINGYE